MQEFFGAVQEFPCMFIVQLLCWISNTKGVFFFPSPLPPPSFFLPAAHPVSHTFYSPQSSSDHNPKWQLNILRSRYNECLLLPKYTCTAGYALSCVKHPETEGNTLWMHLLWLCRPTTLTSSILLLLALFWQSTLCPWTGQTPITNNNNNNNN